MHPLNSAFGLFNEASQICLTTLDQVWVIHFPSGLPALQIWLKAKRSISKPRSRSRWAMQQIMYKTIIQVPEKIIISPLGML